MIPARIGSERLKMKNIALLNGRPMVSYVIDAAIESGVFDQIVLNADDPLFADIAKQHGVEFYLRPSLLGSSTTKSDQVVADFLQHYPCDVLAWVNSVSPLQSANEIADVVNFFKEQQADSLFTIENKYVHACYDGVPLNFSNDQLFSRTQDLIPVSCFVYSVMMWRSKAFRACFDREGRAMFVGKTVYYPVSKESAMLVKTKQDFELVESILRYRLSNQKGIQYYAE